MNQRASIRKYRPDDAPELFAAVQESRHELLPWMPWATAAYSLADAERWVQTTLEGHDSGVMYDFAIVDAADRYVGGCGLNQISNANKLANLGYWVRSSSAGRGAAVCAVQALVEWAFERTDLNRLEVVVAIANTRSRRVAEKTGATLDAVLRQRLVIDGLSTDAALYSFVRPERGAGPPSPPLE